MVASADEEALDFPEKMGEAKSLVAQKEEESANDEGAQDLVNNTMSTDIESAPASPSKDLHESPAADEEDPEATSDDEASTASKSVAASSLHVGEMEDAAPEGPTAASDDEASTSSTRFGAVE